MVCGGPPTIERPGVRPVVKILVIAAHPDDELLGVGGTVAKHVEDGDYVGVLIACEGISMRYLPERATEVRQQSERAAACLGVHDLVIGDLPDQKLDTLPLTEIIGIVEQRIADFQPEVIYTHFAGDLNHDHRRLAEAVLVATRPYAAPSVRELLMFETPSSTEWGVPQLSPAFQPNVFVDVSRTLEQKVEAFSFYSAEVRDAPHPRSLDAIRERARYWGSLVNRAAAEPFALVRGLR